MEDNSSKITRRDFLKFLGYGTAVGVVGMTLGKFAGSKQDHLSYADNGGSWQLGPKTLCTAIHAALLYNGKIYYHAGSDYNPKNQNGPYKAAILNPATNTQVNIPMSEDLWCGGHTQLANGNLLISGGTLQYNDFSANGLWYGLNVAYEFDVPSQSLLKRQSMAHGRWYPTLISLPGANVACFSGLDEYGCYNQLTEIYDQASETWSISYNPSSSLIYCVGNCTNLAGAGSPCYGSSKHGVSPRVSYYPRMHLMPSGLVALVGMNNAMWTWNPSTGVWVNAGRMTDTTSRTYGTSILLPLQNDTTEQGKILLAGGAPGANSLAINSCLIITPNGSLLNNRFTSSMAYPRIYLNPVILPDGKIVVFGGSTSGMFVRNAVYSPEMFDPDTEIWTVLPPATVPRLYHSVALLLPDGRIWTAGTSYSKSSHELRTEIFSPSYVSTIRPVISGAPIISGGYGGSINIPTPNAANISKVSLIKISTFTHHYNSDQRLIWLQIQSTDSGSVTVKAPINSNLAPPGYYLVHVLDSNSIPSVGVFIRIPSPLDTRNLTESIKVNDSVSTNATRSENFTESITADGEVSTNATRSENFTESVAVNDTVSTSSP